MPYLYQAAVEAHEQGIPMLRSMMLEFPGDIGAEDCETQYMLGGSLLVAPVFRADGWADFYLPEGKWTHLLTGETVIGGGWRRGQYDFHSLPLFVREGAVIPMGAVDTRPDYDFADGVTLHLYDPKDGEYAVTVPSRDGKSGTKYVIRVTGDRAEVETESDRPWALEIHRK